MSAGPVVLFEDEHCLALAKAAGQFVQGTWAPPGERTLEQEVRQYLNPADPVSAYVGIVHRLDRPVSGVLLWAKTTKAARRLSLQFERRRAEKDYWAVVAPPGDAPDAPGKALHAMLLEGREETWIDWLVSPGNAGVARIVEAETTGARRAVTRVGISVARSLPPGCAWMVLRPETGRTHQLRVQSAGRGLPIVGDAAYGSDRPFPAGIALHARALRVRHPILQSPLEIVAPLPAAWSAQGIVLS